MAIGYDSLPLNYQQSLAITMRENIGVLAHDVARPAITLNHTMTLNGPPTWWNLALSNLSLLNFNFATPDFLDCSGVNTADLDFVAGDFTLAAWVCVGDLTANRMVICRGFLDTDGYYFAVLIDGSIFFITNQAVPTPNQITQSAAGEIVINIWYLVGVSRDGASARVYKNGLDVTDVAGVHINPVTSARELHIGIYDNEVGSPFSGNMWNPRIWSRSLSADDWRKMWEMERGLFGV